jgi:hypothetical protein
MYVAFLVYLLLDDSAVGQRYEVWVLICENPRRFDHVPGGNSAVGRQVRSPGIRYWLFDYVYWSLALRMAHFYMVPRCRGGLQTVYEVKNTVALRGCVLNNCEYSRLLCEPRC